MAIMLIESFTKYRSFGNWGDFIGNFDYYMSQGGWGVFAESNIIMEVGDPRAPLGYNYNIPSGTIYSRPGQHVFCVSGLAGGRGQIYYNGMNDQGLNFGNEITVGFSLYNQLSGNDPSLYYYFGEDHHLEIYDSNTVKPRIHFALSQSKTNNDLLVKYRGLEKVDAIPGGQTYNMTTYYECSVKLSTGSSGSITIYRDGEEIYKKTGIQTANSMYEGPVHHIGIGGTALVYQQHKLFGDLYVTNDLNALGPIRVDAISPSANGAYNDFSAVGSAENHWANVDEKIFNEIDYNYAAQGSNLNETYSMETLPELPNTIFAIQVTDTLKKSDFGSASVKSSMYNKNTLAVSYFPTINESGNTPLSTTWTSKRFISETDPFTSVKWTKDSLANVEFGYNVP